MTSPSNTELREAIEKTLMEEFFGGGSPEGLEDGWKESVAMSVLILADIFQAREQQLLTELLGELPDKEYYANGTAAVGTQFAGFNEAIDQVVSVIEKYREGL